MELAAAIALFLGEHKPSTVHAYKQGLHLLRDKLGPARELSDVKPEHLIEYVQTVIRRRDYAPATEQKHIKSLKVFFNWCVSIGLLDKSPAKVVRGKRLVRAVDKSKAMTDEELNQLLRVLRYKPRDYALVLFLADTGCRRGGAAGLQLKDVDWDERVADVTEKGEKSRKVAFGKICADAMLHWLAFRSGKHKPLLDTFIFSHDGHRMNANNVSLIIRRGCKAAGVRVLSSHSLRHRKGHQLAEARIAASVAATALGHTDPMITLQYYYPADFDSAKRALRELETHPDTLDPPAPPNIVKFTG